MIASLQSKVEINWNNLDFKEKLSLFTPSLTKSFSCNRCMYISVSLRKRFAHS